MNFSSSELNQIADSIFLMKKRADTILPKPANSGPTAFTDAFDKVVADPAADPVFKTCGIGVVDFTKDPANPNVWLHNGDDVWRIGSVSKLAIHLAAVQLRDDVRNIMKNHPDIISSHVSGSVTTGAVFDALFQSSSLWKLSQGDDKSTLTQIAGAANAPQLSNIFDFTKTPVVDFVGGDPDQPDMQGIIGELPASGFLDWKDVSKFEFADLLWLTGAKSDDVAASACANRIGLFYIKAVLQAFGLLDPNRKMSLVFGNNIVPHDFGGQPIPIDSNPDTGNYRPMNRTTVVTVKDFMKDSPSGPFTDNQSWVAGSASALTAYMIALAQNKLVSQDACKTIRINLATGKPPLFTNSFITDGVEATPPIADVTDRVTKIGVLRKTEGEKTLLVGEFALLLVTERAPPPKTRTFGMIAVGLIDSSRNKADVLSKNLGGALHAALASIPP